MNKKNLIFIMIIVVFFGCSVDDNNDSGDGITVSIDQSDVIVYTGKTFQFTLDK